MATSVTPEAVRAASSPMAGYAIKLSENSVSLEFLEFSIKDESSGEVFFEVKRDQEQQQPSSELLDDLPEEMEDMVRHVRYHVPQKMLQCKVIETRLKFSLAQDVPNLRLIDRHFFKGEFVKEYAMEFGPCKAGSDHCWYAKYHMPEASEEQIMDYVRMPGGHCTDSFYFVGDELMVHNKATFTYIDETQSEPASPSGISVGVAAVETAVSPSQDAEAATLADAFGKLQSA